MLTLGRRKAILKTCYTLLELTPPVSAADVHAAYRRLVAGHHPDRFPPEAGILKQNAHRLVTELTMAKDFLLDQLGSSRRTAMVRDQQTAEKANQKAAGMVDAPGRRSAMANLLLDVETRRRSERNVARQVRSAIGDLRAERYAVAQRKLGQASQKAPDNAEVYTLWGYSLGRLGQTEAALEKCSLSISLDPDQCDGYLCRGDLHFIQGRARKAADDYTLALKNDPACASAHRHRANALVALGEYRKAARDVARAVDLEAAKDFRYDRNGTPRSDMDPT